MPTEIWLVVKAILAVDDDDDDNENESVNVELANNDVMIEQCDDWHGR